MIGGEIVDGLVTEEEHFFHEGSSMRKIGETYYYVYADMERGKPTALGYATGQSPLGPFQYQGIIIDNEGCDPGSWNNHGSIQCFHGQWYVFYHRSSRGGRLHRRLCIEPIQIMEDGRISEVKMTSQGAGEPFVPGERILGYQACGLKGCCYIDADADYGEKLAHICQGDEAVFRYVRSGDGWKEIGMRCNGSGEIEVYFGHRLAGTVNVEQGECRCGAFAMEAGEYELTLKFRKSQGLEVLEIILY